MGLRKKMAKAYSDDLRRKLLEAHQQGEGSLVQLAARFRVSVSWAKSISATLGRTGRMERPPAGPRGPRSKLTPEVQKQMGAWIARQPDLTLMEIQKRLQRDLRLPVSIGRLWSVLQEMGLRLKKSRSTPPSKTAQRTALNAASGNKKAARLIRHG
jgi:transposase